MYEIFLTNQVKKALKRLNRAIVERTNEVLLELKDNPLPIKKHDISKVSGSKNTYRIRISEYRIIYDIDWKNYTIIILKLEKKGNHTYN